MKTKLVACLAALLAIIVAVSYYVLDPEKGTLDEAEREASGGTYVDLSDGTTHYQLAGPPSGKVVVLIHGGTAVATLQA